MNHGATAIKLFRGDDLVEIINVVDGACVLFASELRMEARDLTDLVMLHAQVIVEKQSQKLVISDAQFLYSNQFYLLEHDLQHRLNSLSKLLVEQSANELFPNEVLNNVLSCLYDKDLIHSFSLVCKQWYKVMVLSNTIWERLYTIKYEILPDHVTHTNWYYLYKERAQQAKGQTLIIDVGCTFTRIGFSNSVDPVLEIAAMAKSNVIAVGNASHVALLTPTFERSKWIGLAHFFHPLHLENDSFAQQYMRECATAVNAWKGSIPTCPVQYFTKPSMKQIYECEWLGSGIKKGLLIHLGGSAYLATKNNQDNLVVNNITSTITGITTLYADVVKHASYFERRKVHQTLCKLKQHAQDMAPEGEKKFNYRTLLDRSATFSLDEKAMVNELEQYFEDVCMQVKLFVDKCAQEHQMDLASILNTVVLSGGYSMIKNFVPRMLLYLQTLEPYVQLIAHPHRDRYSWIGKCRYANGIKL